MYQRNIMEMMFIHIGDAQRLFFFLIIEFVFL